MNQAIPAAICLVAIMAASIGSPAIADEAPLSAVDWTGWKESTGGFEVAFGGGVSAGPWTFAPVAALYMPRDEMFDIGRHGDALTASLGFRGAAKVESRFGAIYSRLSLSFADAVRASDPLVISGLSGGGRNGYYANLSRVDVMALDARFALQMSDGVTGYATYGAEMDLGSSAQHEVALRLKFRF